MHWTVDNVNGAFRLMLKYLTGESAAHVVPSPWMWMGEGPPIKQDTRNGPVLRFPAPLTITYNRPWERVLFNHARRCNPFFHFAESLWMLTGANDVETIAYYNQRMKQFSDDGVTFHGAYGHRWSHHFGVDQIQGAIDELYRDPTTRRVVIGHWDPIKDTWLENITKGKDIPCNTHLYLQIVDHKLELTICNRSNDIMWGMLGANVFHFSFLQEFVATALGIPMGRMHQFSTNPHLYTEIWPESMLHRMLEQHPHITVYTQRAALQSCDPKRVALGPVTMMDSLTPYEGKPRQIPLTGQSTDWYPHHFREAAAYLLKDPLTIRFEEEASRDPIAAYYFSTVAQPVLKAWAHHKKRDYAEAKQEIQKCHQADLREACWSWLHRARDLYLSQNPYRSEET